MTEFLQFATEHYILSTLWIVVFFLLVMDIMKRGLSGVTRLGPQEATIAVNRGGVFVDVRSVEEFTQGHIHGSRHLPLEKIRAGETKTLDKFKDAPIVLVCNYGSTAQTAAGLLEKAEFSKVTVLQGGMQAWKGASMPVAKGAPTGAGSSKNTNKKNKR